MLPLPYRVRRVQRETPDTFTLMLEPAGGSRVESFAPGQFNMLYVFGVGEVPISISGEPADGILAHTTRSVGTVTKAMAKLKRGDIIGVRGPFGTAWPIERAAGRDVVLVAGGIGLAPLRTALHQLMAKRGNYGRVVLLHGVRTPEDILYKKQIEEWADERKLNYFVTVDRSTGSWRGNVGVVTTLIPRAPFSPGRAVAMVCGPEVMMRFTVRELLKRGVDRENIHLSMERNMKCAVGFCGRCQYGPEFICKDGPVFSNDRIERLFNLAEI